MTEASETNLDKKGGPSSLVADITSDLMRVAEKNLKELSLEGDEKKTQEEEGGGVEKRQEEREDIKGEEKLEEAGWTKAEETR